MLRKNKALAVLALLVVFGSAFIACSTLGGTGTRTITAQDGGEEEVLEGDDYASTDDDWTAGERSADDTVGGLMMSVGYVAFIVGSAVLPLLFL